MKHIVHLLKKHPALSGYKINVHNKESYELFFVKGKLETVRTTNTCDKEVTVYVDHGEFRGDGKFFVYPSTTEEELSALIEESVEKALLIQNKRYELPDAESGEFEVESNFRCYDPADLAAEIANLIFEANGVEHAALNAVEIFINKHTLTVCNSRGLYKTQVKYDAMVETIPTYNGEKQSVELYQQYNFSAMDSDALTREIAGKMEEVKARYEAVHPDFSLDCPVILHKLELSELFRAISSDLNYGSVYTKANLFHKGDPIQKAPKGDKLTITMAGQAPGCVKSSRFDSDGLSLGAIPIVEDGVAVNYYGPNRYGQYLGEIPTGQLGCVLVSPGSAPEEIFRKEPSLEVVSMSGLQVDFYSDYIGGEVRLAYYHKDGKILPVTGISIAGKLSEVLDHIQLSQSASLHDSYAGPDKALLTGMKIF